MTITRRAKVNQLIFVNTKFYLLMREISEYFDANQNREDKLEDVVVFYDHEFSKYVATIYIADVEK